ncbi:hypothetical protein NBRGN_043_00840 [Nocardia brasiliensis NBRC 14402]|uniref:WXG100 family type VII secretion target n=1 Tax=Nocardia brasiliensis TaxID=37326 RepID=UPI0002E46565|nr:WXG100 family type VII secretion target [Nocardia brasiliensis]ASF10385.1 WXG100 family type VII secretion target [Nocardia brasiliensis]GAJ81774.1 hypothetical protein NBRGN_043_00840 [Nocardia brasiliensis NBRC 14402]SUB11135.1 WXG100 family type VII secretion target [Nocardia brasiliensis]
MTEQYRADLAHIEAVTAKLAGLDEFVTESLREVEERIAAVQRNWSGKSADAHATAHAEWTAAAAEIAAGLAKMHRAAAAARTSYADGTVTILSALGRGGSAR